MNKLSTLLVLVAASLLSACGTETTNSSPAELNKLVQNWELTTATRNGRETETLKNAYMHLRDDGTATVNIDGRAQDVTWKSHNNTIHISDAQSNYLNTEYAIKELQDSTLSLSVELRNTPFLMNFKIEEEEGIED